MEKDGAGENSGEAGGNSGEANKEVMTNSVEQKMQISGKSNEAVTPEGTKGEIEQTEMAVEDNVEQNVQMEEETGENLIVTGRETTINMERKTQTGEGGHRGKKAGKGKSSRNEALGGGLKPGKGSSSFKRRKEKSALSDMTNFNKGIAENVVLVDSSFKEGMLNIATNLKVNHEKEMGSKKSKLAKEDVKARPPDILFTFRGGSEGMIVDREGEKEDTMMEAGPGSA